MMAIDSDWGHWVQDFQGAFAEYRDGEHDDGYIRTLVDADGVPNGVSVGSVDTKTLRVGYPNGGWCGGMGGEFVKCESEHYVSMERVLTCFESVPWRNFEAVSGAAADPVWNICEPLDKVPNSVIATLAPYEGDLVEIASSDDYAVTQKDDGKLLYRWGTYDKAPTDVRLLTTIALPEEWADDDYVVTRAELAIVHTITNSPNDQIRPEDMENEEATGRLPEYVVHFDGSWVSTNSCYASDGSYLPAGTVLRNGLWTYPKAWSEDLVLGFTNAWYTTLDRDPFEADPYSGSGPRWRLKAPKFGQDLPGVEIPSTDCMAPPVQKDFIKYASGELTATVIDLLDWEEGEDSPLAMSSGWSKVTVQEMSEVEGITVNGVPLTDDLDLSVYIKGEGKPANLYKAVLYLDYELAN